MMKTTLLLLLAVLSISSIDENNLVTSVELNRLTGEQWSGTYSELNDATGEMEEESVTLTVTPDSKEELLWHMAYEYPDHPGSGVEKTLTLSSKGDKINGSRISDRAVNKEGVVKIITMNSEGGILYRKTYMIGDTTFSVRREELPSGEEHFRDRTVYTFTRQSAN